MNHNERSVLETAHTIVVLISRWAVKLDAEGSSHDAPPEAGGDRETAESLWERAGDLRFAAKLVAVGLALREVKQPPAPAV